MTTKVVHPLFKDVKVGDRFWFTPKYQSSRWLEVTSIGRKYATLTTDNGSTEIRFSLETGACQEYSGNLWRSPDEEIFARRLGSDRVTLIQGLQRKWDSLSREQIDQIAAIAQINLQEEKVKERSPLWEICECRSPSHHASRQIDQPVL